MKEQDKNTTRTARTTLILGVNHCYTRINHPFPPQRLSTCSRRRGSNERREKGCARSDGKGQEIPLLHFSHCPLRALYFFPLLNLPASSERASTTNAAAFIVTPGNDGNQGSRITNSMSEGRNNED